MSMHRGAEILFNFAVQGGGGATPTAINNPNTPAGNPNSPFGKVQAAAAGDSINSAYNVGITYSGGATDTYSCAVTASGRYIAADSGGNIISYPT